MKKMLLNQKGSALVTLLVFTVIAMIISSAAITMMMVNITSTSQSQRGNETLYMSESGIENGIIRLLRNPSYSGETLSFNDGSVVITVTGSGPYTVRSVATKGNYSRAIEAVLSYTNNVLSVTSWTEVYN